MNTPEFERAKVFGLDASVDYADGAIVSKTVLKKSTGNISLFAFDAGQGLSEHTAPFDATIQVIDGVAEVVIDGASYMVEAGSFIIMPANIPHAVKANQRFKMALIMIKE